MSAEVHRYRAKSGNPDNDYWWAECPACGWRMDPMRRVLYSNRTVEGRSLAERDAAQHRCRTA